MLEDETSMACSAHGKMRNEYRIFVGKPEEKRPSGRQTPTQSIIY
jgi:hypothetical protein